MVALYPSLTFIYHQIQRLEGFGIVAINPLEGFKRCSVVSLRILASWANKLSSPANSLPIGELQSTSRCP